MEAARQRNRDLIDLTVSNPTLVGFSPTVPALQIPSTYDTSPLGLWSARQAVANYYRNRGHSVDPAALWLTAGTSEAYAQLLALTCDPGDAVAVSRPGYPLLEFLADVAGVRLVPYDLRFDDRWWTDAASIPEDPRLRAVVVVAPNNPAGNYLTQPELQRLQDLCARRDAALVIDAVFDAYPVEPPPDRANPLTPGACVQLILSGLSKEIGLPQVKLSWVVGLGPGSDELRGRVEILADAFLSVSTPVQLALPDLLQTGATTQQAIRRRTTTNLKILRNALAGTPARVCPAEGGWMALLRVARVRSCEDWARQLLEHGVVVQPGYLYDLEAPPHLAISLLTRTEALEQVLEVLRSTFRT